MTLAMGIVAIVLGLICWLGQSLVFFAPDMAQKLGLVEPREDMDETFYIIEVESLGLADLLLAWTLPLAGLLMILDTPGWPVLALVGGGIYLYLAVAIILRRVFLARHGKKIGHASAVRGAYVFGGLWIAASLAMIILAVAAL